MLHSLRQRYFLQHYIFLFFIFLLLYTNSLPFYIFFNISASVLYITFWFYVVTAAMVLLLLLDFFPRNEILKLNLCIKVKMRKNIESHKREEMNGILCLLSSAPPWKMMKKFNFNKNIIKSGFLFFILFQSETSRI